MLQSPTPVAPQRQSGRRASGERRAPVQRSHLADDTVMPAGTIAWWEHEEAALAYNRKYNQSSETLAARGGFGYGELIEFLGHAPTTWEIAQ